MKSPEKVLKEMDITTEQLLRRPRTVIKAAIKAGMIEGLKQGVINPADCHKLIIELLAEEK